MAISAKFIADFSQWNSAVDSAGKKLGDVTQGADKLADGMGRAAKQGDVVRGAFHQFDGVLASLGVHIGPEIRGIEDLANASGKTAGELGKLTTAGLVAGAALAGWKIGRLIADFFSLDTAIANTTAKMLGYGDVAAQTAGAQSDSIALALERTGIQAKTAGEALALNTKWAKEHTAAAHDAAKAHKEWAAAMVELNAAGDGWQGTLETIDGETVSAVQYYLNAGVAQGALATAYGLTDVQIRAVVSSTAALNAADKAATDAAAKLADAYDRLHVLTLNNDRKIMAEQAVLLAGVTQQVNAAVIAEFDAQVKLNQAQGRDASGALLQQTTAAETLRIALDELHKHAVAGISQKAQEQVLTDAFTQALLDEALAIDAEFAALRRSNDELAKTPALKQAALSITGQGIPATGNIVGPGGRLLASDFGGNIGIPGSSVGVIGSNVGRPSTLGAISVTNNLNGILLSTDPAARQQLNDAINASVLAALRNAGARF